ncbi:MAG: NAD(P)-dependent oxidoreductase [Pseudomonadota bacterium]|nr:NAD(P)-dependent oxidoreductase [Pseudomonadota bacterium]
MTSFHNKTIFITGATRGIGKAIGVKFAKEGANVVIAAKTTKPHPKLPGTIFDAAAEIESAGGKALPIRTDIRDENQVRDAVKATIDKFGSIDVLINNASAISLTGTLETPMKRFDLMFNINVRGTYVVSQTCLPHLLNSSNPHILNIASAVNLNPKWFSGHTAYTIAKYGMSMCVIGMSEEFKEEGLAVNALWPKTIIDTAALRLIPGVDAEASRCPSIMADAAYSIVSKDSSACSGNFFIDEDVLRSDGITDFTNYMVNPDKPPMPDIFLD